MGIAMGDSMVAYPWGSVFLYQAIVCSEWQALEPILASFGLIVMKIFFSRFILLSAITYIWGLPCISIFWFSLFFWQLLHDIDSLLVTF